jgi:hypothetical protein
MVAVIEDNEEWRTVAYDLHAEFDQAVALLGRSLKIDMHIKPRERWQMDKGPDVYPWRGFVGHAKTKANALT